MNRTVVKPCLKAVLGYTHELATHEVRAQSTGFIFCMASQLIASFIFWAIIGGEGWPWTLGLLLTGAAAAHSFRMAGNDRLRVIEEKWRATECRCPPSQGYSRCRDQSLLPPTPVG